MTESVECCRWPKKLIDEAAEHKIFHIHNLVRVSGCHQTVLPRWLDCSSPSRTYACPRHDSDTVFTKHLLTIHATPVRESPASLIGEPESHYGVS
jgi:hypothetical protein